MIAAFWSMGNGKNGTTTNMIGTAVAAAQHQDKKVLLLESTFGKHTVEKSLVNYGSCIIREPSAYFEGEGLDYLIHRSKYHLLDKRTAEEGIRMVQEKLAYVPGTAGKSRELYEKEFEAQCEKILSCFKSMAEYIFVDCGYGYNSINQKILNMADIVVVNLSLKEKELNEFFQTRTVFQDKVVYLIGNYSTGSVCNVCNIQHLYRIEDECFGIVPNNEGFSRAMARGDAIRFFKSQRFSEKTAAYMEFIRRVCKASDMILRKAAEFAAE